MIVKRIIRSSECNFKAELSLSGIVDIVQDLITETTKEINCDNITLRNNYQAMWVYTKNKIHLEKTVKWGEEVTIECKSVKTNQLLNYMLTEFRNKDNQVVITSLVEMCVIDINNFHFIRLSKLPITFAKENLEIDFNFDSDVTYSKEISFVVSPMMIDYSLHLNNTQSIHFFLDHLTLEELDNIYSNRYDFIIKYSSQAHYQDKLLLKIENKNNHYYFSFDQESGKNVSQGELILLK